MEADNTPAPVAPSRRGRWGFLALGATAAAVALWWAAGRSSDGERAMVGTWRVRPDGSPADLPVEYEYRPDGTCAIRHLHPDTGATNRSSDDQTWRRAGDTLVVSYPDRVSGPLWDVLGARRPVREVYSLTPQGPDRYRYTRVVDGGGAGGQSVSGTLTRSRPAP